MRLRWTAAAVDDLEHISDYLKDVYPKHKQPTLRKLYETLRSLKEWRSAGGWGRRKERGK